MNKKKILFLSHYGANEQFQEFFSGVAENTNFDVKVIIPKAVEYQNGYRAQYFPKRKIINNVEYIPSKLIDKKRYHLSGYFPELPKTIIKFKPDIVIVTDEVYTIDAWFVIIYKLLFFKKFQIITWSQAHYMESSKVLRPLAQILFWWNRKFIHKFVARNKHQVARIKPTLKNNEFVQHVYWSTDPEKFTKRTVTREEKYQNKKIIGFVGRIVPEKGILNVVQGFKKLPEDSIFLIVGKGQDKYIGEIKSYIKKYNLGNKCILLGDLQYDKLVEFYNEIDLLILPTNNLNNFYELFGRVLPEAMMCKTLVLGSTNGAIPEVIDNEKCLFEQNNKSDMINKINHLVLMSPEEKERTIEKNYSHAIENFSVSAFVNNLTSLILNQ